MIENSKGDVETYDIINIFPFSSDTKRMGIIVYHRESDKHIFYLKGADIIMKQFLPQH